MHGQQNIKIKLHVLLNIRISRQPVTVIHTGIIYLLFIIFRLISKHRANINIMRRVSRPLYNTDRNIPDSLYFASLKYMKSVVLSSLRITLILSFCCVLQVCLLKL